MHSSFRFKHADGRREKPSFLNAHKASVRKLPPPLHVYFPWECGAQEDARQIGICVTFLLDFASFF